MLASRLVTFHRSMVTSSKFPVRFLAKMNEKDLRTVHGRTLHVIQTRCEQPHYEHLTASLVKRKCKYQQVPEDESWRLPLLSDLLQVRKGNQVLENFTIQEIDDYINYLCTT